MIDDNLMYDLEGKDDEDDWTGLTPEEIEWFKHVRKNMEPTPGLTERYVNPVTGEVVNEGGPDTPEVHALRKEAEELYRERMRRQNQS